MRVSATLGRFTAAWLWVVLGPQALAATPQASALPGVSFSHGDWELACDNTRTCRAAGYQKDDAETPAVSVLLTRLAGPGQPVTGKLMLGHYSDDEKPSAVPSKLMMKVNGREVGLVEINNASMEAPLSASQMAALLAVLPQSSRIEWVAGKQSWRLSDQGAAAVLLKMDEFQGRLGTVGALVKPGAQAENAVLQPLPVPFLQLPSLSKPRPEDQQLASGAKAKALRAALRAALKGDDDCTSVADDAADVADSQLSISRLTDNKLLVSTLCWRAAYNEGYGYWVVNDRPPYRPVLVTGQGSDYRDGGITAAQKGRGLGDCWSSDTWTWDGAGFVHSQSATTGMCRMIAAGGAWSLPTIVMSVH